MIERSIASLSCRTIELRHSQRRGAKLNLGWKFMLYLTIWHHRENLLGHSGQVLGNISSKIARRHAPSPWETITQHVNLS